jgi:hypothetical protein
MSITDEELEAITHGIVDAILPKLKRELAPVFKKLDELEARPAGGTGVKYCGTYRQGESYSEGALVTKSGGLWLAERLTSSSPGNGDSGWRLVVKEGRAQ